MTAPEDRAAPFDAESRRRLSEVGLDYRIVDMTDDVDAERFLRADARGFLDPEPTDEALAQMREAMSGRRNIGVFDATAGQWPIATVNGWVTPLTVPGGVIDMWAISSVTVAGSHRRRGIARHLLEGELRAAAGAGIPIAGLTASEATIYGRFGFAPAIPVASIEIDTRRAGWGGAPTPGRVAYVDRETVAGDLGAMHERARTSRSGQVEGWPGRWQRMAGLAAGDADAAAVRGVRYLDENGDVRGALAYTLAPRPGFDADLKVRMLVTETDDALRALWRFIVDHDLVSRAQADLRPVDDPLPWLVADQRAVTVRVHDHGWLRVLDVPAVLGARTYAAPVDVTLRVRDALGFADGTWRLHVTPDGDVRVTASDASPHIILGVAELSAVIAGGVPLQQLAAAGRAEGDEAAIRDLGRALLADRAPVLGIWY